MIYNINIAIKVRQKLVKLSFIEKKKAKLICSRIKKKKQSQQQMTDDFVLIIIPGNNTRSRPF